MSSRSQFRWKIHLFLSLLKNDPDGNFKSKCDEVNRLVIDWIKTQVSKSGWRHVTSAWWEKWFKSGDKIEKTAARRGLFCKEGDWRGKTGGFETFPAPPSLLGPSLLASLLSYASPHSAVSTHYKTQMIRWKNLLLKAESDRRSNKVKRPQSFQNCLSNCLLHDFLGGTHLRAKIIPMRWQRLEFEHLWKVRLEFGNSFL